MGFVTVHPAGISVVPHHLASVRPAVISVCPFSSYCSHIHTSVIPVFPATSSCHLDLSILNQLSSQLSFSSSRHLSLSLLIQLSDSCPCLILLASQFVRSHPRGTSVVPSHPAVITVCLVSSCGHFSSDFSSIICHLRKLFLLIHFIFAIAAFHPSAQIYIIQIASQLSYPIQLSFKFFSFSSLRSP
jgi:hypothetical protein